MIDFEVRRAVVIPLTELAAQGISVEFKGKKYGMDIQPVSTRKQEVATCPIEEDTYRNAFQQVQDGIQAGNSYLLNLTFPTEVHTDYTLEDIFTAAQAAYKVYCQDKFVSFRPNPSSE